jgi:pyruvate dehydrogenase phosphatase
MLASPILLESPAGGRQYGTIKLTDTADHPRNYRMAVASPDQASKMLRTNETHRLGQTGSGIRSISFNQVASNSPIEDDHVEVQMSNGWSFFGIFDGHRGWATSNRLKRDLASKVAQAIQASPETPSEAISSAFEQLDHEIVYAAADRLLKNFNMPRPKAVEELMPAFCGSCALLVSATFVLKHGS